MFRPSLPSPTFSLFGEICFLAGKIGVIIVDKLAPPPPFSLLPTPLEGEYQHKSPDNHLKAWSPLELINKKINKMY